MTTALTTAQDRADLIGILQSSLYPGANPHSVGLVLSYCQASGLDPMLKPVHIVPVWDRNTGSMRDVIMPGIGHYRIQAARSGQFAGMSEPEFGPDVTQPIGGMEITFPAWCKVTVRRMLPNGMIAEFPAIERWLENYAVKGGKEKSVAPNAMWARRPYAQLAKCAEAQALRKAFPEFGSAPTAEEMEGKPMVDDVVVIEHERPSRTDKVADAIKTAVTLDQVLDAYKQATTPDEIAAADADAKRLTDAEKEIARKSRKERLAELKKPKDTPAVPFIQQLRSAATQEERDTIMSESATLDEAERAKVEAVWLEMKAPE